jgi:type IV pilus assembly protein PilY1
LDAVGQYYTRTDDLGPWGNGPGEPQLSCRPSFSILTTDGYWNDKGAGNTANTGYFYESYTGNITTDQDADGRKVSLADIAMYYYKTDLRPPGDDGLENDVPPSTADPADWQHMVTFGLSIGLKGTLTVTDPPASNSTDWPNPMDAENKDRIDDLWHAAVNGHGSFVAASNPTEFAQGLIAALSAVADRTGSASNVSTNSTSFQDNSAVYQASYKFGLWTGEVQAYKASADGVESTPLWSASDMVPDYGERTIVTWNGSTGVDFPTDSQKSALGGDDNVNYIKGDQSKEKQKGGALRTRTDTVLGDIVNSSPAYSTDSKSLFVGANDGMLHAFDSETGIEQFAYVPAGIRFTSVSGKTGLDKLSDPTYLHGWFVDGPVVVSQKDKTGGVNYLIGALGRGGKGLFALDVTDPSTFSASNVKWDLTGSAAPSDMGEVLGEPLVVKFNDGTTGIIASNGVNSSGGVAALFVLNIETGSVVKEFKVDSSGDNGLSAPRGWDDDGNGTVDYVYAGDLKGNLWKFDLSASSNTGWKVANSDSPMFVATDASDKRQPITAGLGLARDPTTSKRWVFIGTGKFLEDGDILTTDVQSMYGIIDDGTVVTGRTSGGDGDLQKRQIVAIDTTGKYRGFEAHGSLDGDVKGWYIDLLKPPSATAQGERIVNRPIVSGTVLITASMVPPTDDATCDAGGSGYINALDAFTGTVRHNRTSTPTATATSPTTPSGAEPAKSRSAPSTWEWACRPCRRSSTTCWWSAARRRQWARSR